MKQGSLSASFKMTALLICIFSILTGFRSSASSNFIGNETSVLSYKAWKLKKVDEAQASLLDLKSEPSSQKDYVEQALRNVKLAKSLSPNDYFLLYLSPQFHDNEVAYAQAAKHLSPIELAEILVAYQKNLERDSASSPKIIP
jgi:hypothetical protein